MDLQQENIVKQGINILVEEALKDFKEAKIANKPDLYNYTKKYFYLNRLIRDYLPSKKDFFDKKYFEILNI